MELAKVMSKGQVTIPVSIRKRLNLKEGDKVIFLEKDGSIVIANSATVGLALVQEEFADEAERLGLENEQDVVDMVKEVRRQIKDEQKP